MDIVYVFRHSQFDDLELRYSLRSIATYAPYIRKVWVFGDRPEFLSDDRSVIEHVPHEAIAWVGGHRAPVTNFFLMLWLSSLIPELSFEYLWLCDDFILLQPLPIDVARQNRYLENMDDVENRGRGLWKESLWRTYDLLKRLNYPGYNFETHTPTYYTKKRVFEAYRAFRDFVTEDRFFGMLGPSAVLSHALRHESPFPLTKVVEGDQRAGFYNEASDYETIFRRCRGPQFLNFDDKAFNDEMQRFLSEKFPTPCVYERRAVHSQKMLELAPARGDSNLEVTTNSSQQVHDVRHYPTPIMKDRSEFGGFLNAQELWGEGAEVGVAVGAYSESLLKTWRGRRLHCIDPWTASSDDSVYIDINNVSQDAQDRRHAEAVRRLSAFADRCQVHRQTSREAAASFAEGSLDFVYLDARHYADAVREDLDLWAPKVRSGGYLAGHDYLDGILPSGHFQVKSTVDAWARQHGLLVACSGEHIWRSWFIKIP